MVPFYIWFNNDTMVTRRDVFQAIADPTRREIIHLLANKSHNLVSVVNEFDVSRPAIAKHLRILVECGLVETREEGREKYFSARLEGLREVSDWTEQYKTFWTQKLDALGQFLEQGPAKKRKSSKNVKKKSR
ncbi:MAG TPA: metalloregulator ArsR/SmtB family transcription factor [Chryseosolibacter sp.]